MGGAHQFLINPYGLLFTAVRAAIEHTDTVKAFAAVGLEARASSSAELAELLKRDTARWGPVVKSVGFTVDS